jgi:hypothetical protein
MSRPVLGIMTFYINQNKQIEDRSFLKSCILYGDTLGLDVLVFTPEDIDHSKRKIYAHVYTKGIGWVRKWRDLPNIIFDRCRYQPNNRFKLLRKFRAQYPELTYLNRPLANKWVIYKLFYKNAKIRPFLPRTKMVGDRSELAGFLDTHKIVYLKPINGTGGRGILRAERLESGKFKVEGRNLQRKIISPRTMTEGQIAAVLSKWSSKKTYIMQQGIDIRLNEGRVHDYRMLLQKNGKGQWDVTGSAGRIGAKRSVTSNLHGGGKAVAMEKLLGYWFQDKQKIQSIMAQCEKLALDVIDELEREFESLCELALDIAVDRSGHIWLLEINPKPGRDIFRRSGELEVYRSAVTKPLEYALWLAKNK